MKKVFSVIAVILVAASVLCVLAACDGKDEGLVSSYEIADSTVKVGDKHGTPTITAHMTDGTDKTVSKNLVYDEEDLDKLLLDDEDKYTKAGEYTVKVYILEQQEKFFLGNWKIIVKAVK